MRIYQAIRNIFKKSKNIHFKLRVVLFDPPTSFICTILCGGYWLWVWQISGGLQTCIAERLKVPNESTEIHHAGLWGFSEAL